MLLIVLLIGIIGCSNGGGSSPDPISRYFAYIVNSDNVSAFSINATAGRLMPVTGSPFAAGNEPRAVIVDSSGKFAYVANAGSNNVSAYSINAMTGALTPVADSPFAACDGPYSIETVKIPAP